MASPSGVVEDHLALADQVVVLMRVGEFVVVDPCGQRHAHQPAVVLDDDLAVREGGDQRIDGVL